jgi:hypothetical protein
VARVGAIYLLLARVALLFIAERDQHDGHSRESNHALGVAAHHKPGDAATPMGTHHDQPSTSFTCLLCDHLSDRAARRIRQQCLAFTSP